MRDQDRRRDQLIWELKKARTELEKPISIQCECGGKFIACEAQADVNRRWACEGCGHEISTGPAWGGLLK